MNHLNNHRLFRPFVLAILVLVSFAMARTASAQDTKSVRSISGRVADASGQGIPGVGIIVKGTTMGVITTDDGSFELQNVSDGFTIVVSCMGYVEQEFKIISTKSVYNVVLSEDEMLLDDVVVVGYGTQKKEHLTGAVAQVTAKELENRPVANLGQALQGMVPNLKVTVSSGKPGAGASFQIRGTGSPNGGSPLILVDGVESYPDRINTNDIESISVLKDAASSAIYGAKAAFGVILITSKRGSKEESRMMVTSHSPDLRHLLIMKPEAITLPELLTFSWNPVVVCVIPTIQMPTIRHYGNAVTTRQKIQNVPG